MQPHAEHRARNRLVAEVETLDRQQMRRIIGLQADLELPAHTVRGENRADRQPDALEWGAGVRTGRLRETWWHPLPGIGRSRSLVRLSGRLWAPGVEPRNRDDWAAHVRERWLRLGAAPLGTLSP